MALRAMGSVRLALESRPAGSPAHLDGSGRPLPHGHRTRLCTARMATAPPHASLAQPRVNAHLRAP
jgi:hypothetical protein